MKTKILSTAALLIIYISTGYSQINTISNAAQDQEGDPLTAMNSVIEDSNEMDSYSNFKTTKITTFPEFVGNGKYANVNEYIYSNLEFPEEARITGRTGLVKVQFDIYPNGAVGNIDFIESPDLSFNEEMVRLLTTMPKWKPALSGATAVKSRYQLNINFSLR